MKRAFLILFLILLETAVPAQERTTVSGKVFDISNGEALAGVVLQVKSQNGANLAFTTSAKDGTFSMKYAPSERVSLAASLVGYRKVVLEGPFSESVSVSMEEDRQQLYASVIKESRVKVAGDTITYSAAALRAANDRTLGNILERIPGLEVSSTGRIKFQGTAINRLYIDGKDLLESNYNYATENLQASSIKSIDIYQNHQPVKALRNLVESENAAINITLNDDARNSWSFNGEGAGGVNDDRNALYDGSLNVVLVADAFSSLSKVGASNVGNTETFDESQDNVIVIGEERHNRYRVDDYIHPGTNAAPLGNEYATLGRAANFQTYNNFMLSDDKNINFVARLKADDMFSGSSSERSYTLDDDTVKKFTSTDDRESKVRYFSSALGYVGNGSRMYLREQAFIDVASTDGRSAVSGDRDLLQNQRVRKVDINNILASTIRLSPSRALSFDWYTQASFHDGITDLMPSDIHQSLSSDIVYSRLSFSTISSSIGKWALGVKPDVSFTWRRFGSESPFTIEDAPDLNLSYAIKSSSFIPSMRFSLKRMEGRLRIEFSAVPTGAFYRFSSEENRSANFFYLDALASLKYNVKGFDIGLDIERSESATNLQKIGSGAIITGFDSMRTGRRDVVHLPSYSAGASLKFREPFTEVYVSLYSNARIFKANTSSRVVYSDFVLDSESDNLSDLFTLNNGLRLSKGIAPVKGRADLLLTYGISRGSQMQNGALHDYSSNAFGLSADINANPVEALSVKYTGDYSLQKYSYSGLSTTENMHSLHQNLSVTLMPKILPYLSFSLEHLLSDYQGRNSALLANIDIRKHFQNRHEVYFKTINLMNQKQYTLHTISPLMQVTDSYLLRPRSFILGYVFNF